MKKTIRKTSVLFILVFFLLFISLISYGIYLFNKINHFIHTNMLISSNIIYSNLISVKRKTFGTKKYIISLLINRDYMRVKNLICPSGFCVAKNSIELISYVFFPFSKKKYDEHVQIFFLHNKIIQIKNLTSHIYYKNCLLNFKIIRITPFIKGEKRLFLALSEFPKNLIKMLLIVEDKFFYSHIGISFRGILRAFIVNLIKGKIVQGGSTITQQLMKNLFFSNKHSFCRKLNEIYMALIFNWNYGKNKTLELYLNEIYFGQDKSYQIRGFGLASLYYFSRPINELSLDEYALLVGMIKGASLYNPCKLKTTEISLKRRNLVLYLLFKNNIINRYQYMLYSKKPLKISLLAKKTE